MTRNQDSTSFLASALMVSACVAFSMQRSKLQESSTRQEQVAARSIQRVWRFSRMTATVKCEQGKVSKCHEQADPAIIVVGLVDEDKENVPGLQEDDPLLPSVPTKKPLLVEVQSPVGTPTSAFHKKEDSLAPRATDEDDLFLPDMLAHNMPAIKEDGPVDPSTPTKGYRLVEVYSPVGTPTNGFYERQGSPAPRDIDDDDLSLPDMLPPNMSRMLLPLPGKENNRSTAKGVRFLLALCAVIVAYMITVQSNHLRSIYSQVSLPTKVETVMNPPWLEVSKCLVDQHSSNDVLHGIYGPYVSYS